MVLLDVLPFLPSGHLSLIGESYTVLALETRSNAIRRLATTITTPSDRVAYYETNPAACLAFVIHEASVGNCRALCIHLKGTHNIIKSASTSSGG